MGKGSQQTPQDLSRMIASVERLARIRDYLRDSRDVSGTVEQLTALIDEARRASGQVSQASQVDQPASQAPARTPPIVERPAVVSSKPQGDTERYTRLGVGIAHDVGSGVLGIFGMGGLAPAIGNLEKTALDASFA